MRKLIAACIVLPVILTACSRQPEPEESMPPLTILFQDVRAAIDADNIPQAMALLDEAYADDAFAGERAQILNAALSIQLSNDMVDDAVARFNRAAQDSPEIAEYSFGMLASTMRNQAEPAALLEWTASLLPVAFSEPTAVRVYITHAHALLANDKADETVQLAALSREKFASSPCLQVYRGMISSAISLGKRDAAVRIIDAIASGADGDAAVLELVTLSRMDLLIGDGKWEEYAALLGEKIADISGPGMAGTLARALRAMDPEAQRGIRERVCLLVIEARKADEACVITAARHWMNAAAEKDPAAVPARARRLLDKGIAPSQMLRFLPNSFYAVLNTEDPARLQEMVAIAKELRPALTAERDLTTVNSMILDGSFILNDYDTAITMVEQGVPGRDEAWHASALEKLKAHRALDAGNTEEAVKHFREFMKIISETMDREVDPSTGMTYTASWCLGRNAKRIGDLLKKAGEADRSADAYREAKKHFQKALTEFPEGSRETDAIAKEMAEIPQA